MATTFTGLEKQIIKQQLLEFLYAVRPSVVEAGGRRNNIQ
jgi:hypothetical protein